MVNRRDDGEMGLVRGALRRRRMEAVNKKALALSMNISPRPMKCSILCCSSDIFHLLEIGWSVKGVGPQSLQDFSIR